MTAEAPEQDAPPEPPRPRRRRGRLGAVRWVLAALVALLPWLWYAVRDADPRLEWAAIALPLLVAAAVGLVALLALVELSLRLLAVALAWALFGVVAVAGPWQPADQGSVERGVRVATANVGGGSSPPGALVDDLLELDADVLAVSELSPSLDTVAQRLDAEYPHAVPRSEGSDVSVWSRFPVTGEVLGDDLSGARGARVVVDAPPGRFALYGLHLRPPNPDEGGERLTVRQQRELVERLDAAMDADALPAVVAGDLNVPDRGPAFQRLAEGRVDAARASRTGPTSLRDRNRLLLLRIDHLLVPSGWCADAARRAPLAEAEHRAVVAEVGRCAG